MKPTSEIMIDRSPESELIPNSFRIIPSVLLGEQFHKQLYPIFGYLCYSLLILCPVSSISFRCCDKLIRMGRKHLIHRTSPSSSLPQLDIEDARNVLRIKSVHLFHLEDEKCVDWLFGGYRNLSGRRNIQIIYPELSRFIQRLFYKQVKMNYKWLK